MDKLLVITGPTATGKTALGLELARKFNGEILSADSRQVYRGMDIGTGKDLPENSKFEIRNLKIGAPSGVTFGFYRIAGVPVWGLDIVEPDYPFNVSDYVDYANAVITDIQNRNKLPIIIGGTGHYIKELLSPSETLHIPPDPKLRNKLKNFSLAELQQELIAIGRDKWESMNNSDRNNPRRLVRAIEVAEQKSPLGWRSSPANRRGAGLKKLPIRKTLIIGLWAPYDFLYKRIDKRVDERVAGGMAEEKIKLRKYKSLPNTLGYKNEALQKWKFAEHAYARRQMTWWRKQPDINWLDISRGNIPAAAENLIDKWYNGA